MAVDILSDVDFFDPDNLIPYAELDDAIVRGVTLALLDFSNPDCHSGSGAIGSAAVFQSLTVDRANATTANAFDAIVDGMLKMPPAVSSPKVNLPASFLLPSTCERFLVILWVKAPKTGWPGSGSLISLLAAMTNSTTTAQWGLGLQNNAGTISNIKAWFPGSATAATEVTVAGGALDALLDSALHQLALQWEVNADGTTYTARLLLDGAQVGLATGAYAGSINVPALTPVLGRASSSFITTYADGVWLGRPSLWDLTDSELTVAEALQSDVDAAAGWLA